MKSDWLSRFRTLITVTGKLEIRGAFGAPWGVIAQSAEREIPYHVVLRAGRFSRIPTMQTVRELGGGDFVMLPHGSAHMLHGGSRLTPVPAVGQVPVAENAGTGERLDILCGRFHVAPPRMARATFMSHFQSKLGRSAIDLLTDIRMSVAANELRLPAATDRGRREHGRLSVGVGISARLHSLVGDDAGRLAAPVVRCLAR